MIHLKPVDLRDIPEFLDMDKHFLSTEGIKLVTQGAYVDRRELP
jgi:hypothetical protein